MTGDKRRPRKVRSAGTSLELFTGGGGLALAMHESGFHHALVNEYDHRACETLRMNNAQDLPEDGDPPKKRWPLIEGDVHELDFTPWDGKVDVLGGGVPCQPWSLGGVHRGREDKRNLWPEFARAARETRPKALLAENVRGLLRPDFRAYWAYTLDTLRAPHEERLPGEDWEDHARRLAKLLAADGVPADERYDVDYLPVNAADYGVPQVRKRVLVVGLRRDLGAKWTWPAPTHSDRALREAQEDGSYWAEHRLEPRPVDAPRVVSRPERDQSEGALR